MDLLFLGHSTGNICTISTYIPRSLVNDSHPVLTAKKDSILVEGDGSLDGALVPHGLETLSPLLEFEHLVDNSVDLYALLLSRST